MKIKKNNFLIGALLTFASLGVAGSITGTYAWYSYNTKSPVVYSGIATGDSQNLQVSVIGDDETDAFDWKSSLSSDEFSSYSIDKGYAADELSPVTFEQSMDAYYTSTNKKFKNSAFKGMPSYGDPSYTSAGLKTNDHYNFFKSKIAIRSINPADEEEYYARKIYLSDITCDCTSGADGTDVSEALRVVITDGGENYHWIIAPGKTTDEDTKTGSINLYGPADLDGDDYNDKGIYNTEDDSFVRAAYDFELEDDYEDILDAKGQYADEITYGKSGVTEGYYFANKAVTKFSGGVIDGTPGFCVGETWDGEDGGSELVLYVWIYLQGWEECITDENIGATFNIGLTFECQSIFEKPNVEGTVY